MSQNRFERRKTERQKDRLLVTIGAMCLADGTVRERLVDGDRISPLRQLTIGELQILGVIEWTSSDSLSKASCSQTGATQLSSGWPASLLALLS